MSSSRIKRRRSTTAEMEERTASWAACSTMTLHAKRVLSVANATLGDIRSASLAVNTIGQGLALARGRVTKHAGRRYIVCRNHQEAEKDAAERQAILASLERQLKRGDKVLVGNAGYRRFRKAIGPGRFAIDRAKAEEDARFDGIFVVRANTALDPLQAMLR